MLLALLAVGLAGSNGGAQPLTPASDTLPFAVGERLDYEVRYAGLRVGSGSIAVEGVDTVRGRPAWHVAMRVRGGPFFFKVDDTIESWLDARTLDALRFRQRLREGRKRRARDFEIFPGRATYTLDGGPEQPGVDHPLDDAAFLYFVRTVPLEVGRTYEFHRYFRPESNPVLLHVVRRERIQVPAGTYDALVVQPIIRTGGLFAEGGAAELWLADDPSRVLLQLRARLSIGALVLQLRSYEPGGGLAAPVTARDTVRGAG